MKTHILFLLVVCSFHPLKAQQFSHHLPQEIQQIEIRGLGCTSQLIYEWQKVQVVEEDGGSLYFKEGNTHMPVVDSTTILELSMAFDILRKNILSGCYQNDTLPLFYQTHGFLDLTQIIQDLPKEPEYVHVDFPNYGNTVNSVSERSPLQIGQIIAEANYYASFNFSDKRDSLNQFIHPFLKEHSIFFSLTNHIWDIPGEKLEEANKITLSILVGYWIENYRINLKFYEKNSIMLNGNTQMNMHSVMCEGKLNIQYLIKGLEKHSKLSKDLTYLNEIYEGREN